MARFLKIFLGICIVLAFAAGGVYGTRALTAQDASDGQGRQAQPTRVGVVQPERRTLDDTVTGVGTLMPIRSVDLVPNVPGRVTDVPVVSGQTVQAGDTLIQMDDRAARAALSQAEATQSEARQALQRVEELADRNTAAEARLEGARAVFLRADAAVMRARADLEDRVIKAPFAGILGLIDTEPGAFLDGTTPVTRLSDLSVVKVSVSLPERYFDAVTPDQTLTITTPAYPGETFDGVVTVRAPQIDLGTRSFDVQARIDNSDGRLVGGMFANSSLVLNTYDGLAVPDDAIISEGLTTYVFVVRDGTAARTEVTVGTTLGQMTEVRDGLDAQDRVVVAGWDQLTDGAAVDIDENFDGAGLE